MEEVSDDMGIPLATADQMVKRSAEHAGGDDEPKAIRQRLEHVNLEDYEFDVSEIFTCPRIVTIAEKIGLQPGYSH